MRHRFFLRLEANAPFILLYRSSFVNTVTEATKNKISNSVRKSRICNKKHQIRNNFLFF